MKPIATAAVLILSLLLAMQTLAATPITATLTLPHDRVLPGVPFDLVVTYTNVSEKPVVIDATRATLLVTFENGDAVVMDDPDMSDHWTIRGFVPARLAPGESVQHAASWERGHIPNWFHFHGSSFSGPGSYRIALDLRVFGEEDDLLGAIRTPAIALTRVEPVGIDGELWKRMQDISNGRWNDGSFKTTEAGVALADEIIQLHPASGYYPYVLALRAFREVREKHQIAVLLEAAERFAGSPAYPYLLSAAANCARYAGGAAARDGNIAEADKYLTLAEAKYREALATKSIAIRASAELGLENLDNGRKDLARKKPKAK